MAEALSSLERALAIQADYAEALEDRGNILMHLLRHAEAADSYSKALSVGPASASLYYNRANARSILARYEGAIADSEKALALDRLPYARGVHPFKLQSCDWRSLNEEKIGAALKAGKRLSPFNFKALSVRAQSSSLAPKRG
jgi:tetratricopeptide (TPR) repeat protein